jgi:hypothetical protein
VKSVRNNLEPGLPPGKPSGHGATRDRASAVVDSAAVM